MFHWKDHIYFGRRADGSVRLIVGQSAHVNSLSGFPEADAEPYPDVSLDVTIPAAEWASIVSSVSKTSETSEIYQAAVAFHG